MASSKSKVTSLVLVRWLAITMFVVVAIAYLVVPVAYVLWFHARHGAELSPDPAQWGQLGDYIGGILNPVIALASLVVLAWIQVTIANNGARRQKAESDRASQRMLFDLFESEFLVYDQIEQSRTASVQMPSDPQLLALCRKLDQVGYLVNRQIIGIEMLVGFYRRWPAVVWAACHNKVSAWRATRATQTFLYQMEMLCCWAVVMTHDLYPDQFSDLFGKVPSNMDILRRASSQWRSGNLRSRWLRDEWIKENGTIPFVMPP